MYKPHRRPALHRVLPDILRVLAALLTILVCLTADGWVEYLL